MPSPANGSFVEYGHIDIPNDGGATERRLVILRTFSAQIEALKSAVAHRTDVTFLQHGNTIEEQLAADAATAEAIADGLTTPPEPKPTRKPKPVIDRDVAPDYDPNPVKDEGHAISPGTPSD